MTRVSEAMTHRSQLAHKSLTTLGAGTTSSMSTIQRTRRTRACTLRCCAPPTAKTWESQIRFGQPASRLHTDGSCQSRKTKQGTTCSTSRRPSTPSEVVTPAVFLDRKTWRLSTCNSHCTAQALPPVTVPSSSSALETTLSRATLWPRLTILHSSGCTLVGQLGHIHSSYPHRSDQRAQPRRTSPPSREY